MFGIVRDDASGIAGGRLYTAIDDAGGGGYGGRQRQDLTTGCISLLQSTSVHMQRYGGGDIPLPSLSRACLLAVGSICGAAIFGGQVFKAVSIYSDRHLSGGEVLLHIFIIISPPIFLSLCSLLHSLTLPYRLRTSSPPAVETRAWLFVLS